MELMDGAGASLRLVFIVPPRFKFLNLFDIRCHHAFRPVFRSDVALNQTNSELQGRSYRVCECSQVVHGHCANEGLVLRWV